MIASEALPLLLDSSQRPSKIKVMITVLTVQQSAHRLTLRTTAKILPTGRHLIINLHGPTMFTPWSGFGVLCAYAAVILAIGTWLLVRRDA